MMPFIVLTGQLPSPEIFNNMFSC